MRCPRCNSDETSLSWLREHSILYFCRSCRSDFEVDRGAVQSTAKPEPKAARGGADEAEAQV